MTAILSSLIPLLRSQGVSMCTVVMTDTTTLVDLYCKTDDDLAAVSKSLLDSGATWQKSTYLVEWSEKQWLRGEMNLDGLTVIVIGPHRAAAKEAA